MTTNPAWTRSNGIEDYGGHAQKSNYMGQGKIDARTDVDAAEINRMASDLAAGVATAPFLVAYLTQDDTGTDDPTVHFCAFQPSGVATSFAGDNPPAGFPTFTRTGDGVIRVTFAASYTDEYGNSASTTIRYGKGGGAGSVFASVTGNKVSDILIDFYTWDDDGTALIDQPITIRVY